LEGDETALRQKEVVQAATSGDLLARKMNSE